MRVRAMSLSLRPPREAINNEELISRDEAPTISGFILRSLSCGIARENRADKMGYSVRRVKRRERDPAARMRIE